VSCSIGVSLGDRKREFLLPAESLASQSYKALDTYLDSFYGFLGHLGFSWHIDGVGHRSSQLKQEIILSSALINGLLGQRSKT